MTNETPDNYRDNVAAAVATLSPEQARAGLIARREQLAEKLAYNAQQAANYSKAANETKAELAEVDRWIRAATPRKSPTKKVKP